VTATVDEVLARRAREDVSGRLWRALAAACGLHLLITLLFVVVPRLTAEAPKPPHFVAVSIVPARALPRPPAAVPAATAQPAARPQPAATAPPSPSAPVLPQKKKLEAKPTPHEAPAAPTATPAAAAPAASAAPGAPQIGATVAGLDNPAFTYGYYLDQMLAMIESQWVRPALGSGIETTIAFRIERNGSIADLRGERSSGYSSFDLAGLRAVQAASPLPPLPSGYAHPSLGVNLIFK